jgi:hypothetical protein
MAGDLEAANARLAPKLDTAAIVAMVENIPDDWLLPDDELQTPPSHRAAYVTYLTERLAGPMLWLTEAQAAQTRGPTTLKRRLTHRVAG